MKRFSERLLFVPLFFLINLLYFQPAFTQSKESWPTSLVSLPNAAALKTVDRLVVFVSADDPNLTNAVTQALSIELQKLGWDIMDRVKLQDAVAVDYQKWLATQQDTTLLNDSRDMDESAIAQLVNADFYLAATVLVGRKQYGIQYKDANANSLTEKIVVTTISFQIVNAKERTTIMEGLLDFIQGEGIPFTAEFVRKLIQQKME